MTLNKFLEEWDGLSDERIIEGQRKFLKNLSESSNLYYLMYSVRDFMCECSPLENDDDFFGTEGMDI